MSMLTTFNAYIIINSCSIKCIIFFFFMKLAIITSCTSRKRSTTGVKPAVSQLKRGSCSVVADQWTSLIAENKDRIPAGNLYAGRAALEIKKSASLLNADLWFISAGMGFVGADQLIPSYDLTISKGNPSYIGNKIASHPFNAREWWNSLDNGKSEEKIHSLFTKCNYDLVILTCPTHYFNMIAPSLEKLPQRKLSKLRIIGPKRDSIPDMFDSFVMPYDHRLNGPDSQNRGTQSDFAQRATHDFAKVIVSKIPKSNRHQHAQLVHERLSQMDPPLQVIRRKKSDTEITDIILENWSSCNGRSAQSLRMLRDKNLVSCEQKRFSRLFNEIKVSKA
jgi:hypothetical protein